MTKKPDKKMVRVEVSADLRVHCKFDLDVSDCENAEEIEKAAEDHAEDAIITRIMDGDFSDPECEVDSIRPILANGKLGKEIQ